MTSAIDLVRNALCDIPEVQKIYSHEDGSLCSAVVLVLRNDRLLRKLVSDRCDEIKRTTPSIDFDFRIIPDADTDGAAQLAPGWSVIFSRT